MAESVRIVFTADVHVGRVAGLGARTGAHQKAILETFERVADLAAESADLLVIAGDLIDRQAVWGTFVEQAVATIQRALEQSPELRVVVLAGNHDPAPVYRRPEWQALDERVVIVTTPTLIEADRLGLPLSVVALPWQPGEALTWDRWPDGPVVLAAHTCFPPPVQGSSDVCVLREEEVAQWPAAFVGLGHYHRTGEHKVGEVPVVMVGAPEIMDLGHVGHGCVALVTVESDGPAKYEMMETGQLVGLGTQTVQWLELGQPRMESLRRRLREMASPEALLRVAVEGPVERPISDDLSRLVEEMADEFFFLDLVDKTVLAPEVPAGPLARRVMEMAETRAQQAEKAGETEEAQILRQAAAYVVHLLEATEDTE